MRKGIVEGITFAVVLSVLTFSCDNSTGQETAPSIPPIGERVGWDINRVPANLVVEYPDHLEVAYPIVSSTPMKFEEVFVGTDGIWKFIAPCAQYVHHVRPTPTAWRKGINADWQPYTLKTHER